jgi:hypothetical protein
MRTFAGLVVAATLLVPAAPVLGGRAALPRSTTDRPDDRQGSQIHALYVLPSDGADRALDTDGTIEASVQNFQTWLRGQTGGRGLRLDTFQGQLDVTFVRLSQTDAQLASSGLFIRDAIERELRAAGFTQAGKIYALYYDGSSTAACGGGAWPPTLPGQLGGVYLRATFGAGFLCYDPTRSRSGLQLMDLAVLHELLHTMGFVATCSPHHTRAGHVSDSPSDLMWAGDAPWTPSVLDVGRDDYFDAPVAGCPDLADSAYLEGNAVVLSVTVRAAGGRGVVRSNPAGIDCGATCSAQFERGTTVTLTAAPLRGSRFLGWSGACTGHGPCAVVMDGAKSVAAAFGPSRFVLSLSVKGPGRVTSTPAGIACPGRCQVAVRAGSRVALRAVPNKGARLSSWSGACRGRGKCTVTMNANRRVAAGFRR